MGLYYVINIKIHMRVVLYRLYRESISERVQRDAYKNRRGEPRPGSTSAAEADAENAWKLTRDRFESTGSNAERRSRECTPAEDYRPLSSPRRPFASLTPSFIPLFVSRVRSDVVLSSLRPCRANRRAGTDIPQ